MPSFRSTEYTIWHACERFGIMPPEINKTWESNNVWGQSQLIAYDQIRGNEENEKDINMYRALGVKI